MIPVHVFERHDEAYRIWSASAIRGATIVHVDAHHDLAWLDTADGLNIGNYLCQAIKDGIAATIYWVVPDGALSSVFVRSVVTRQLRALRASYGRSSAPLLRSAGGLSTELMGARLFVCEIAALPRVERPLLDIDTDFLVTPASGRGDGRPSDRPWLLPRECVRRLRDTAANARLVTIAYSVEGGYTPIQWKYLGDELAVHLQNGSAEQLRGFERMTHAHTCATMGRMADAERALAEAAASLANPAAAEFMRARLLVRNGQPRQARAAYQSAIARDPSYSSRYNSDGPLELGRRRFDRAKQAFTETLTLDASHRDAHLGLAAVAKRRRRWQDVERHAGSAAASGVASPYAHRLLAEALERQGRRTEAVAALEHSLRIGLDGEPPTAGALTLSPVDGAALRDEGHARAYASLGRLEAALGLTQPAIAALRLAIAGGDRRPTVHARLARLYAANRRWRAALAEAARAFAMVGAALTHPRRSS